jgi:hypothetical protein
MKFLPALTAIENNRQNQANVRSKYLKKQASEVVEGSSFVSSSFSERSTEPLSYTEFEFKRAQGFAYLRYLADILK